MKKTINIVCAADDRYAPMCGIMLTSLFENNKDCHVEVYVLTSGFSDRNTLLMNELTGGGQKYDACVHIVKVDEKLFEGCPVRGNWSIASYYRMAIPKFLPEEVNKVIYLDVDILINGSLLPLFETDITDYAIAASDDFCDIEYQDYSKRLGFPVDYGYFNGGVLLINLSYWREHHMKERLFQYVTENPDRLEYIDQDALNGLLYNQRKPLPGKYNVQTYGLLRKNYSDKYKELFLKDRPVIVHYTAKPWNWGIKDYPFRAQWEEAVRKSPWKSWNGTISWKRRLRMNLMRTIQHLIGKDKVFNDAWKVWA